MVLVEDFHATLGAGNLKIKPDRRACETWWQGVAELSAKQPWGLSGAEWLRERSLGTKSVAGLM